MHTHICTYTHTYTHTHHTAHTQAFKALYIKCVVRDTPLAGTEEAKAIIKTDITID